VSEQQPSSTPSASAGSLILAAFCVVIAAAQVVIIATTNGHPRPDSSGHNAPRAAVDLAETDRLKADLQAADASVRVASAVRLLRSGLIEAGDALLEVASGPDGELRKAAIVEFGRVARPMGETVGFVLDWPASADSPPTADQIRSARAFWERWATPTLLFDVQARLAGTDHRWAELKQASVLRDWLRRVSSSRSEGR